MIKEMQLLNIPSESILTPITAIWGQIQGNYPQSQAKAFLGCLWLSGGRLITEGTNRGHFYPTNSLAPSPIQTLFRLYLQFKQLQMGLVHL